MDTSQKGFSRKPMLIVIFIVLALLLVVYYFWLRPQGSGQVKTDLNYANFSGTVTARWRSSKGGPCIVELTSDLATSSGLLRINETVNFTGFTEYKTCTPDLVADLMSATLQDPLRSIPDWARQAAPELIARLRSKP